MESILINILNGLLVGLLISLPMGPGGLFSVQHTLSYSKMSGIMVGLGIALSDIFYSTLALVSLTFLQSFIDKNQIPLLLIGGVVVIGFGISLYVRNPLKRLTSANNTSPHWSHDFLSGFAMTIINPGSLVLLFGILTILHISITEARDIYSVCSILLGIACGSICWWITLNTVVNRLRKKIRMHTLITINKLSGIFIMTLGGLSLCKGLLQIAKCLIHK